MKVKALLNFAPSDEALADPLILKACGVLPEGADPRQLDSMNAMQIIHKGLVFEVTSRTWAAAWAKNKLVEECKEPSAAKTFISQAKAALGL